MELRDALTPAQQLELAVRTKSPADLARTFAEHAGQFYRREDFDTMARTAHDLYAADSAERASLFRARLDRRLCDRYRAPVAWDPDPSPGDRGLDPSST
jgi:hypothetical protein